MGYNTVVVFYNDSFESLRNDPEIGKKIASASDEYNCYHGTEYETANTGTIDTPHESVGRVVAVDHADVRRLLLTGENGADDLDTVYPYGRDDNLRVRVLKRLADQLGYRVSKKR